MKKDVELIIQQVNLLQELSQGITRYPTPALSQVWRCKGFHRVLNVLFSNQNWPSRIQPHVLTMQVDKISHWAKHQSLRGVLNDMKNIETRNENKLQYKMQKSQLEFDQLQQQQQWDESSSNNSRIVALD